ncbi:MAG: flavodoxin domain-containing protein [Chloroflexota bacterium]|nr:flavodoxin domain-containing protein [Chloroflexota bacterium]
MAKVLIVYSSQSGSTAEMADAVAEGAKSVAGTEVVVKKAADATADDLISCNAVAFGSQTTFGYISGALKDFFDRTLIDCREKTNDKPYCTFTSSGMGKRKALDVLDGIAIAYSLKKIEEGIMSKGKPASEDIDALKEMGKKLACC